MIESVVYPSSFIIAMAGLALWMLLDGKKGVSGLASFVFLCGLLSWAASVFLADALVGDKVAVIARDLLAMGFVSILMRQVRTNKAVALALFVGTGFFVRFSYLEILKNSFPPKSNQLSHYPKFQGQPELLVDLRTIDDLDEFEKLLEPFAGAIYPAFQPLDIAVTDLDDYFLLDIDIQDLPEVKRLLSESKFIDWVEENESVYSDPLLDLSELHVAERKVTSNDPLVEQQWAITMLEAGSLYEMLNKPALSKLSMVKVAVLDTGVDGAHPDLASHYVSTKKSYDRDVRGHGTHVAGIVAAITGNGIGVASLLPANQEFLQVTSIKVLSDMGGGTQAGIINGMIEAADAGAKVISMSLGGRSNDKKQKAYNDAVRYCNDHGAIVVVSAGNSNNNSKLLSPANAEGVIAVTALDRNGNKAAFSSMVQDLQYGIAAPGVEIMSTWPGGDFREASGTSMAAPYVSSLVGIMLASNPNMKTAEVHRLLEEYGATTSQVNLTGKRIQPAKVMQALLELEPAAL